MEGFNTCQGKYSATNIVAATVVKKADDNGAVGGLAPRMRIARVQVVAAGSAAGAVYDSASTTGDSAANQVGVIPNAVGTYTIDMPCLAGICIAPGAGQTVSASFD